MFGCWNKESLKMKTKFKEKKKANFLFRNFKKGELTTQQIIGLIILITSFLVILFFFFRLNLGGETQNEICHNSVVLKAKSVTGFGNLDCKTNYLCISGGGECEGINPTQTIKIDLSKDNAKNETMKSIADEIANCWWMFGEGKINYVTGFKEKANPLSKTSCAVCSIVKFDKTIQEKYSNGISYKEFIDEGLVKLKYNQDTYLRYIYGVNNADDFYKKFEVIKEDVDSEKSISFKDKYIIRTGLKKGSWLGEDSVIYPYFFDVNNVLNPQCDEFITKA